MKTFKIIAIVIVEMNEESADYYQDNQGELLGSLMESHNVKVKMEETTEPSQEKWS